MKESPARGNQDRSEALSWALAEAQLDAAETGDEIEIVTCIGEPWCCLYDQEARDGMGTCLLCDRYRVSSDGTFVLEKNKSISPWGLN